jgi:hypothetical protein
MRGQKRQTSKNLSYRAVTVTTCPNYAHWYIGLRHGQSEGAGVFLTGDIMDAISNMLIASPLRDTYIAAAVAGIAAMCAVGLLLYIVIRGHNAYDMMMAYHASRENELSRRTQDK